MALNNPVLQKFKNAFEIKCFQLIVNAYSSSLTNDVIQLNWEENDISAELQKYLQEDPLRKKFKISTSVEAHIPDDTIKTKGYASKYPRIDFKLTTFVSIYEYEYFFEAKNLKENNSALKRRYINTGIDNFTLGKYSNGSLLGYLLEGTPKNAVKGINSLLIKDGRKTEILNLIENELHDDYFESNHQPIGVLKHFIFDFTSINN